VSTTISPWQPTGSSALAIPSWAITLNGSDVTSGMMVERIAYAEATGGEVPTFQVDAQDIDQRWQNYGFTLGKDTIVPTIGYQGGTTWNVGTFSLDELALSTPPDVFSLMAVEAGLNNAVRTRNSVAYEGKTLSQIAAQIAAVHGMTALTAAVSPDPVFDRVTQRMETDLAFLLRLAHEHNYDFVIRGSQLIFYSRPSLEAQTVTGPTLTRTMIRQQVRCRHQGLGDLTYKQATVAYFNPHAKTLFQAQIQDPTIESADTHKAVARVENGDQAALKAQSNLWTANMHSTAIAFPLVGTLNWRAGNTVNVSGFGKWDLNTYLVQRVEVEITPARGFVTTLELRTVTSLQDGTQSIASQAGGVGP
jgi:Bacteriophage probable baseplate hub protein